MTLELLFPHFDELIRTPEDVQRLNETILQLAVQGKLVPQDAGDEPAGELLKRMEIEKERLIASKVIGSSGRDVVLDQTQAQYTLPNQWSWAPVADAGYIERGVSFPVSAKETTLIDGHIACLRTTNIQANVDWQDLIYIPRDYVTGEAKLVYRNDIMISMANSFELVGKVSYVDDLPMEATFGGFIAAFRSIGGMYARYVFLVMKSPFMQEMFRRSSSQTTNIANISLGRIYPLPFPVPPLAEQHRIVAKVDELFAQTRALEAKLRQAQADIVTANRAALHRLHRAQDDGQFQAAWRTLRDHFDLLYDDPRNVAELRQAILDLAVRGKLVPQDPSDEPAEELLKRIASEKKRLARQGRTGKSNVIRSSTSNHLLPDLPPGWEFCLLDDLLIGIDAGHSFVAQSQPAAGKEYGVLKISAVTWGKFLPEENKALLPGTEINDIPTVKADDILITRANTAELVGAVVLVDKDYPNLVLSDKTLRLVIVPNTVVRPFIIFALRSLWVRNYFAQSASGTSSSMRNLSQDKMRGAPLALPPLAEQQRIVAKVDQLMQLCDALQAGLVQAEVQRRSLTAAVLSGICRETADLPV